MPTLPSTDYPDFQPSAAYNQTLLNQTLTNIGAGGNLGLIPVVSYQSLRIIITPPSNGISIGAGFALSSGGSVFNLPYSWEIPANKGLDVTIPCDGPFFEVIWSGASGAGQTLTVLVLGITRPTLGPTYQNFGQPAIFGLGNDIAPGTTLLQYTNNLVGGTGYFYFQNEDGYAGWNVGIAVMDRTLSGLYILHQAKSVGFSEVSGIVIPPAILQVFVHNNDGANFHTMEFALITKGF